MVLAAPMLWFVSFIDSRVEKINQLVAMFVGICIPSLVISFLLFCGLPELIFTKMPCYKANE